MASELDGGWEVYKILKLSYGGGGGAEGEGPIIQFTKNINKKTQKNPKKTKITRSPDINIQKVPGV